MNKTEYDNYVAGVRNFFKNEGLQNLTGGHITCPDCGIEFDDEFCPECGVSRGLINESYFSWGQCDCCGTNLGGNRQYATGWDGKQIREYEVCDDCIYFAEYGTLEGVN